MRAAHRVGVAEWSRGPVLTILTAGLVEALAGTPLAIPVPHPIMLTAVVYGTYIAGRWSGMTSVAIMVAYTLYYFSLPGQLFVLSDESVRRVVVLSLSAPVMVLVVDRLRRRARRLQAVVEAQKAELADRLDELLANSAELAESDARRSEFLAVVAHQLRAPLTNLRGAVDCLRLHSDRSGLTDRPGVARILCVAEEQVVALDQVIGALVGVVRADQRDFLVQPEPVSVAPLIERAVLRSMPADPPRIDVGAGLPLVNADPELLVLVLGNLLDNASKYGGGATAVRASVDDGQVAVTVEDRGPGVPPERREQAFARYTRLDDRAGGVSGYGLGLYVCRRVLAAQGGRITLGEAPGGGAAVTFSVPALVP